MPRIAGGEINGVVNLSRCIPPKMYYGGPIGFTSVEECRLLFVHELEVLGYSDIFRREFNQDLITDYTAETSRQRKLLPPSISRCWRN